MLLNETNEQEIRKTVEKILKRKEFQQDGNKNSIADMIKQVWESILEWVRELFKNRQPQGRIRMHPGQFDQNVETILKIVLIVLGAVLLFVLVRLVVRRIYLPVKAKKTKIPKAHEYLENPDLVLEKMNNLIEQGKYTEALRFLFVAVLLEFHRQRIIKIEKWKTNRIYLREIAINSPQLTDPMKELTTVFNACCYGNRIIDAQCMDTWLQFYKNEKGKNEKENKKND